MHNPSRNLPDFYLTIEILEQDVEYVQVKGVLIIDLK